MGEVEVDCDVGYVVPIISIVISSVGVLAIGYYVYNKLTQLRIFFWINCMISTLVSVINFIWLRDGCLSEPIYNFLINLIFAILYLILVVWCFLDLGKKFYPLNKWKTPLYNITIIGCAISIMVMTSQIILLSLNVKGAKYLRAPHGMSYIILLVSLILGLIVVACSFLYTFKPIIRLQFKFSNSTNTCNSPSINSQNIAVGWWYMTVSSLIAISYFSFGILNATKGPRIFCNPLSNSIDFIHRTLFMLNVSMPPSRFILNLIKFKCLPGDLSDRSNRNNSGVNSFEDFVLENANTINDDSLVRSL